MSYLVQDAPLSPKILRRDDKPSRGNLPVSRTARHSTRIIDYIGPWSTASNHLEHAMREASLYLASCLTALWGIAHLFATRGVVAGFGELSPDNRRIITMEWIVEGVALISLAGFVAVATVFQAEAAISSAVYGVAIATLIVLTVVSMFTGFRIDFLPFRLCPFIFGASAALIGWGAWG